MFDMDTDPTRTTALDDEFSQGPKSARHKSRTDASEGNAHTQP